MVCSMFSYEHRLDYQTLSGKEPMLFWGTKATLKRVAEIKPIMNALYSNL